MWQSIEEREGKDATWGYESLKWGTAIASGKTEIVVEHGKTSSYIPGVKWCYISDEMYARGVNYIRER